MRQTRLTVVPMILLLAASSLARHQSQSLTDGSAVSDMSFSYKFESPRFPIRLIEIDIGSNGVGELRFKRGESDEILDCKVKLLPATSERIRKLYEALAFLNSAVEYQDKKDFSHLGWVTLGAQRGSHLRKVRFNFTTNEMIKELEEIFRGIATQEISLFDIENAERYQPLDVPKQLELLENDLKLTRITEPERVLVALNEIAGDDSLPLIARNHAKRIIDSIKKGKFKSPMKKSVISSQ